MSVQNIEPIHLVDVELFHCKSVNFDLLVMLEERSWYHQRTMDMSAKFLNNSSNNLLRYLRYTEIGSIHTFPQYLIALDFLFANAKSCIYFFTNKKIHSQQPDEYSHFYFSVVN